MIFSRRLSRIGLLVATLTIMGSAISIDASTINTSWKGGTGNWSVSTDWTNGVPNNRGGNVYNATIDSGGTDLVSLDINATIASIALGGTSGSSTLQNLSGKAESLEVTGATTINNTGGLTFGNTSTLKFDGGLTAGGQVNLTGATATITGSLTLKSGSAATVSGGSTLTVNGNLTNSSTSFETANGTGNKVTVSGGFSNSGSLLLFGTADTLTVSKTLTNNAGATLALESSGQVANISTLSNSGVFNINGGTANIGAVSNSGTVSISAGTVLNVTGAGSKYTQTAGTTTDDGSFTLPSGGALSLNSGSLFGRGTITGAVTSSGTITPGDSSATTGILTEKGAYTQNFAGVLDMSIGGTTVGAQFDQFTITGKASLNGALNVAEINGFTPTSGETFDIVNFASKAGAFSSCNGHSGGTTCTINSTEHFLVEYNPTNVTLKVVPGASSVTLAGTPEPSTLLMLGSGGLLLLAHLRGRERQSKDQGQSL